MVFQFEHVDLDSGPSGKWDIAPMTMLDLKHSLNRWQEGLAEVGWNSLYLGNHDQPRCVSRFGNDAPEHREQSAKALATVLHLHRGTPYVYQGDELGLPNVGFTRLDQLRDIESLNYHATAVAAGRDPDEVIRALSAKGRDNARVPMPWDASPSGGFTTGSPWIEVHPLVEEVNAAAQVDDPDSVFAHFQRLIALRHDEPVVAHGSFRMLLLDDPQVYAFVREYEGDRLLVVANLSDAADVVADLSDERWATYDAAELLIGSVPGSKPSPTDPLAPWESRVFRLSPTLVEEAPATSLETR